MDAITDIEERVVVGQSPERVVAEHLARYRFAAQFVHEMRVLDAACGSGYGSRMLYEAGAREVVGLDLDRDAVEMAHARYGSASVEFLHADVCRPPDLAPFDVIVSFETIEHLSEPARFLNVCRDLLTPTGVLVVSTPYRHRMKPDGSPLNPFHFQEWTTPEFTQMLGSVFSHVTLYGQGMKIKRRKWLPLPPRLARPLARAQGVEPKGVTQIYPLPGPQLFGLWRSFPAYLVAVCKK